jgi:hypothetical protein
MHKHGRTTTDCIGEDVVAEVEGDTGRQRRDEILLDQVDPGVDQDRAPTLVSLLDESEDAPGLVDLDDALAFGRRSFVDRKRCGRPGCLVRLRQRAQ